MSTLEHDALADTSPDALQVLRNADAARQASPEIEAALLEAFDTAHAPRAIDWQPWLAIAAVLVLAVGAAIGWLAVEGPAKAGRNVFTQVQPGVASPESPGAEGPFVPWPGAATLPEFEGGELVRTKLPATVLPLLGIPPTDAPADGHVVADVLYGQDGQPRAVRVVTGLRP